MKELAIVALTPRGLDLGHRIVWALGRGEVVASAGNVRTQLTELFQAGRPLVCIMALGIVVRILGPLVQDKESDPAVVVVDEGGQFAISMLGGHEAGANLLATDVAKALQAIPVITTASEALKLPPLDLIGRAQNWRIEGKQHLKKLRMAMLCEQPIAMYREPGLPLPETFLRQANFRPITSWPQGAWAGVLVITDRYWPKLNYPTVIYRPLSLVLGIGCRRGVPCEAIEAMFQHICETHGFSPLSLALVASATLKADEPGLLEFARQHDVPTRFFSLEELAQVGDLPTPSARVLEKLGVAGVAEPAAMLAAGTRQLLLTKQIGERITMAIARRADV